MKKMLCVLVLVFLVASLYCYVSPQSANAYPTFSTFLDYRSTMTNVVEMKFFNLEIAGDWGALDTIRVLFNTLGAGINYSQYVARAGINTLGYILQFLQFFIRPDFWFNPQSGPGLGGGGGGRW